MAAFTTSIGVLLNIFSIAHAQSSFVSSAYINPFLVRKVSINNHHRTGWSARTARIRDILPRNIIDSNAPKYGFHTLQLHAKKKKKSSNVGKGGKIQVKLTKDVAGTGQAGTVIKVAPAFFENMLKRTNSAVRISDEEVEEENRTKSENMREQINTAIATKEKIDELVLSLPKKTGPDGRLFGGVSQKLILEELGKQLPEGSLDSKKVKIKALKDENGKNVGRDIKQTGEYKATIMLLDDILAEFVIKVIPE